MANGGRLGARNVPGVDGSSGVWSLREIANARREGAWPTDPYFTNVVALLHMDGADGSTTFVDERGHTVTPVGNAQIDTSQSKFGGASCLLDGSGDRLTVTYAADMDVSATDLTLEFFVRPAQVASRACMIDWRSALTSYGIFIGQQSATPDKVSFRVGDSNDAAWEFSRDTASISVDTWVHVALTRQGNTLRAFWGGTQVGADGTFSGSIYINSADLFIGALRDGNGSYDGWIDEFRLTVGVARYTANFTPPTAPFPNA